MTSTINLSGTSFEDPTCAHCSKTGQLSNCSRCGLIQYCSRECQRLAWRTHKAVCGKPITFTLPDGSKHTAVNSDTDGFPVIKKPLDPVSDAGAKPMWKLAEEDESIPRETVALWKKATEEMYCGNYTTVLRPYFVKSEDGKYVCREGTKEKVVHFHSTALKVGKCLSTDGAELTLVPVLTKPFLESSE